MVLHGTNAELLSELAAEIAAADGEAAYYAGDVADPETIDKTWRITTRAPEGPLQLVDIAGLNTVYNIAAASDEQGKANARYIKEHYIDKGKLGRASGEGFYKYETVPARSSRAPGSPATRVNGDADTGGPRFAAASRKTRP